MFRVQYIFEFKDVVDEVKELAPKRLGLHGLFRERLWIQSAIRGFLAHELYLNLLPDPTLPHIHRDGWNLANDCPHLVKRIHRQIRLPVDLANEWVKLEFDEGDDLYFIYDFRPTDFSIWSEPCIKSSLFAKPHAS